MILPRDNSPKHINNKHANNKRNQQFGYNALPPEKIHGGKHPSKNQRYEHCPHKPFHIIIISDKGLCPGCFLCAAEETVKCAKNGAKKEIDLRVGVNEGFDLVEALTDNRFDWLKQFFHVCLSSALHSLIICKSSNLEGQMKLHNPHSIHFSRL